jgi:class 3 adenylate cyclase
MAMDESSFTEVELAARARVAPERVGRLVELGILRPADGEGRYGLGDVRRVRLVDACAQAEPEFYHDHVEGPLLASGMDEQQMRQAASQMSDRFRRPGQAVVAALEMVERTPQAGLPPAHVGLHAGPVVFQDGDYFGRTVNLAARIAGHAGPGQVLVSDQVVAECADGQVAFEPIGPVPLKGVTDPVPLHRASRQAPGG